MAEFADLRENRRLDARLGYVFAKKEVVHRVERLLDRRKLTVRSAVFPMSLGSFLCEMRADQRIEFRQRTDGASQFLSFVECRQRHVSF